MDDVTTTYIYNAQGIITDFGLDGTFLNKSYFGGTDEERTKDFQQMLDDPKVKAIMCARGGYGAVRIIDNLRYLRYFLQIYLWYCQKGY